MTRPEVIIDRVVVQDGFVPVIDISSARSGDPRHRQAVADAIGRCCENSGFLLLVGHGVPYKAIHDVKHALREFFALPPAAKDRVKARPGDPLARGFSSAGKLAATNDGADVEAEHQVPDRVEKFVHFPLGNPEGLGGTGWTDERVAIAERWPELPGFRAAYQRYYAEMATLATELSRLFALALGLRADWFDASIDRHHSNLMANYYPADDRPAGEIRLSQHSDWGNLTILLQDESQGGLQVRGNQGEWLDVPVVPGAFVINIGDLLARWTNDRWVSTVHRVVSTGTGGERYSLPFFHQPNFDAVIECIPSPRAQQRTIRRGTSRWCRGRICSTSSSSPTRPEGRIHRNRFSDNGVGEPNRCAVTATACSRRNVSSSIRPASTTGPA